MNGSGEKKGVLFLLDPTYPKLQNRKNCEKKNTWWLTLKATVSFVHPRPSMSPLGSVIKCFVVFPDSRKNCMRNNYWPEAGRYDKFARENNSCARAFSLYISLSSFAKQQREMITFCVVWWMRTWACLSMFLELLAHLTHL